MPPLPLPRAFRIAVWLAWLVVLAVVIAGSVMPLQRHVPWESAGISHFLAYAVLGFLPMLTGPGWGRAMALLVGMTALGMTLEWIQSGLPDRFGTWQDAIINTLGTATGTATGWLAAHLNPLVRPPNP